MPLLAWPTLTDPFLIAAFWIGLAAVVMIALLVLQIVVLRVRLRARERRAARVVGYWRPIMTAVLAGDRPRDLPLLDRADEFDFFKLWLHFQASLRGEARASLNWLALDLGCDRIALRLLARANRGEKLLAILVLGHLGKPDTATALEGASRTRDRLLAVHASLSLVQIDAQLAARAMAPGLVLNAGWPVREVVLVLAGARAECTPVLTSMLQILEPHQLPRLLQVMEGLRIPVAGGELSHLLKIDSVEVQTAALRIVSDPTMRSDVLRALGHADWRVRMHAAKALGRVGRREDVPALMQLLSDREWWVRYRTAQVLAGLPFLKATDVQQIAHESTDRFAADMLRQVMAESGMVNA